MTAVQSREPRAYFRRCAALLLTIAVMCGSTGCNAVVLLGYLIGGPPSIEPEFNKQTKKDLAAKGKRILVLVEAPDEVNNMDFDAVDRELAKTLAVQLIVNKITVIDPDRVYGWLASNPDYEKPAEVGAHFKADYVVHVDLTDWNLYEENTQEMYRGRSEFIVNVIEMKGKTGSVIWTKSKTSRFPTRVPISVTQYPRAQFKKTYMTRLGDEIGSLFYPTFAGDDIPYSVIQ